MDNDFVIWLTAEMDNRGWNNSELARRAGITASSISLVLTNKSNPGLDVARGVAKAMKLPAEFVFRRAGLLPPLPPPENDPLLSELLILAKALSSAERRRLVRVARLYFEEQVDRLENE